MVILMYRRIHPQKSNTDTNNDGLEHVSPFKHGYFGYLSLISGGYLIPYLVHDRLSFRSETASFFPFKILLFNSHDMQIRKKEASNEAGRKKKPIKTQEPFCKHQKTISIIPHDHKHHIGYILSYFIITSSQQS